MAIVSQPAGGRVEYYGLKDAAGLVTQFTDILIFKKGETVATAVTLNPDKSPASLIAPSGEMMKFIWDNNQLRIIAVDKEGKVSLSFPVEEYKGARKTATTQNAERRSGQGSIEITDYEVSQSLKSARTTDGSLQVRVTKCGKPYQGQMYVYLNVLKEDGNAYYNLPSGLGSSPTGTATYSVPTPGQKMQLSDLCNAFDKTAEAYCSWGS